MAPPIRKSSLSRGRFLDGLGERPRRLLAEAGKQVDFLAGSNLVNQGDPAPPVFVLHSGFVKVLRTAQGDSLPVIVDLCGAGELVGIEDCLGERSSHIALVATKPGRALEIPQQVFRRFLDEHQHSMALVGRILADRARLRDIALAFASTKVRSRLTAFLARQQVIHGIPGKNGVIIDIGLNHADIASAIGASAAAVSAEMVILKNEGYISTGYKTIHVKKQLRDDAPAPFEAFLSVPARRLPPVRTAVP